MVTFSSTTVIVFSARIESDKGDNTLEEKEDNEEKDKWERISTAMLKEF